ncbi:hypothetical protein [Taylorella equigenitalis]|uniref:hypothetical protein n=1 Tax=Taylorella equigenitalis TaxID=29575 RepID=UPI0003FEE2C9|nr:hypothetical protein [Taylorella equigenitalis]ASY42560.1 hypothetical protein CA943_05530 [Taylorella equigenitalis]KGK34127.1 hypothetical protein LW90_00775 [Taylorella equigenitalis]WDU45987.1 hypothetical protein KNO33_05590 [Taylorella equigenitalis]
MNITVKEFMDQTKCSKASINNRLSEYINEIKELRENGYTFNNIVKFLSLNGINTTVSNVQYFYKKHIDKTDHPKVDYENMSLIQKLRLQLAEKKRLEAQQGNQVNDNKNTQETNISEQKPTVKTDINNSLFNTEKDKQVVTKRTPEQIQQDKERLGDRYDERYAENGGEYRPKWSTFTKEDIF